MTSSGDPPQDTAVDLKDEPEDQLKRIPVLWEEYKYRHDLCWRVMFRLTSAVVILAIVPYVYRSVFQNLPGWVLGVPASLAVALAGFGIVLMKSELDLFRKVKDVYRDLKRDKLYVEDAGEHDKDTIKFEYLVFAYLGILVLLSLINLFVVVTELPR